MPVKFKEGDLVWAKMKGFSPWPGLVAKPNKWLKKQAKTPGGQCIYFFGTRNYGWVEECNIKPYFVYKEKLTNAYKSASFQGAVQEIEEFVSRRQIDPNCKPFPEDKDNAEFEFDKLKEIEQATTVTKPKKRPIKRTKPKLVAKKLRLEDDDNENSTEFVNHVPKNYEELLNRPTVLDRPDTPPVDISTISETLRNRNIEASTLSFGFLGLGIMGSGIVKNLIYSGHKINLWNRSLKKAEEVKKQVDEKQIGRVEVYDTPCDVVENSNIIFCCVSDPRASKDIVYGNCGVLPQLDGSLEGKGYVEMTSIDPETSKDICNVITSKGGRYLEAQIQGSNKEANEANLVILGAGDKTLFDDCQSCFKAMGKTAFYLGEVGFATKMNLILQTINGVALAGLAEGFALADRSGLFAKDVLEIFELTNMSCPALVDKANIIIKSDFPNTRMPLQHMQKDLKLALEMADSFNQPLLMTSTANEIFKHTRRLGYDKHDSAAVYMRARH
ncbi:putative oxidoreductase GLYR1 homolog [Agrilus planipennis]|uniref:Cytokine-like nuclear factor N-PAC n=1 Tax=Agrilus planipennis TaxID=224129 RepID=A0A1W4WU51_AGRPL|nr:putative oxidoreductase GLYR1 homolog [Agrilus planipennis]